MPKETFTGNLGLFKRLSTMRVKISLLALLSKNACFRHKPPLLMETLPQNLPLVVEAFTDLNSALFVNRGQASKIKIGCTENTGYGWT